MSKLFHLREDYSPHPFRWWHIPLLLVLIGGTIYVACTNDRIKGTSSQLTNAMKGDSLTIQLTDSSFYRQSSGEVFGTIYHITYDCSEDLQAGIDQALKEVDESLSPFNKSSVITTINQNQSMQTNERFRHVFLLAQQISAETDGAFDITCAPLVNAWGFGFKNEDNVDSTTIDSLLQFVGYQKIALQADTIVKQDARIMLDCSAIAKGYGVDAVAEYFESQGVQSYMVEIGGEVRTRGCNAEGNKWRIGINKPTDDPTNTNQELEEVLEVSNTSMATSGNYRNYYVKNSRRYAHTIDPRTGYPVQHSLLSATVLAPDCATADAYATSFMVMGLKEAQQILTQHPELMAYLIYTDEKGNYAIWQSEGMNTADEAENN